MSGLFPGLPHFGRYRLVSADVPWEHANYAQAGHGAAKAHYDEMSLEDLCRMPVGDLAHPAGSLLFLWSTGPQAADGAHLELARAWGYRLTTRIFAWVKTARACAACLHDVASHGPADVQGSVAAGRCAALGCACQAFAVGADFGPGSYSGGNVIFAPAARRHSEKPEAMQDRIEALWPHVAPSERLELFARRRRPNWACWGGQCPEPDLVFGDAIGAWWPLTPRPEPAPQPVPVPMFAEGA